MAINDEIRDEKLKYDINREAAKISALSSRKTHKYEILLLRIYYHLINDKKYNRLDLLILVWEKLLKNK